MKKLEILIIFLVISFTADAGFIDNDFNLDRYNEIRNPKSDHVFYKTRQLSLKERVAGIYFSMKEESTTNMLTGKKQVWCINDKDFDVTAFLADLDNEIKYNKDYSPKMSLTKAVRELLIRRNLCRK